LGGGGPLKDAPHYGGVEADGLEHLRAGVGGDRGDAHLGHDLEDAAAQALDVVLDRLGGFEVDHALRAQFLDRVEGDVGVDRGRAVAEQDGGVVDAAAVAGLDDERDLGAGLLAHQVLVDGGGQQERRDRREVGGRVAVGEHEDAHAVLDGLRDVAADLDQAVLEAAGAVADLVEPGDAHGLEAGHVAVVVDVEDLGELVVVEDRAAQLDLAARVGAGFEDVALGADRGAERGHELLADGVERRVGDLREQLREVVVEQLGALGEARDGRVGAHRDHRLGAAGRHGRQDEPELLVGVAEGQLAAAHGLGVVDDVLAVGQLFEADEPGVEPVPVGVLLGEGVLDLLVVDYAALRGVDEEHAAGLEAALLGDLGGREVDDARLRGEHDEVVGGAPPAGGAQAVAVEDGADLGAVGEADARGAVPRLHDGGVVAVEVAPLGVHGGVVLPRLGDHHEHGVGQAAPAQVEQLDDLVEVHRVRGAGRVDGEDAAQPPGQVLAGELRLAGGHPVAVAADGVDLAVVGDHPVRVGERPRREGVRGEARVDQREGAGEPLVLELGIELGHLRGCQHALVDDGAGRQAHDRGAVEVALAQLALGLLAHDPGQPVELDAFDALVLGGEEDLRDARHGGQCALAQAAGVDGDLAPAQDAAALGHRVLLDDRARARGVLVGERGEHQSGGVVAGRGEREVDGLAVIGVGDLDHDPRAVARVGVWRGGTAVLHADEGGQASLDDAVRGSAVHVHHEGDTAGVVFPFGAVKTGFGGQGRTQPWPPSSSEPACCGDAGTRWCLTRDDVGPRKTQSVSRV
jgi:hypothetical protein